MVDPSPKRTRVNTCANTIASSVKPWADIATAILSVFALFVLIYSIYLILSALRRHRTLEILPISVTKSLSDQGYTPTVLEDRVAAEIHRLLVEADSQAVVKSISTLNDDPDVMIPSISVSLDALLDSISARYNIIQTVRGEVVNLDGQLSITLRIRNDVNLIQFSEVSGRSTTQLVDDVARKVLARTDPYQLGLVFQQEGNDKWATLMFRAAIELNRRSALPHTALGLMYESNNNCLSAFGEFEDAIDLDYNAPGPHGNLGLLYEREGQHDLARNQLLIALAMDTHDARSFYNLAIVSYDEAKQLAESGLPLSDSRVRIKFDEADALLRQSISLNPRLAPAYFARSAIFKMEGDNDQAEQMRKDLLQIVRSASGTEGHYSRTERRLNMITCRT